MLTLYFSPGSSSLATHIALYEVGVPFEAKYTPLHQEANRAPGYLALNLEGKVPTLIIDDHPPLTEVAATLWYLARHYPEAGLLPQLGDIEAEARVISWMSFIASTIHPARRIGREHWRARSGPPGNFRSPTSTCSACSGAMSTRCTPISRPFHR
jgi:glutathione S-transferase